MADFRLEPAFGLTVETYDDPSNEYHAGRLGEVAFAPHRHLVAGLRQFVEIHAVLDEETEPRLDADLDVPFRARWAEAPDGGPQLISPSGGSAIIRTTPTARGHYVLLVKRPGSGGAMIHFDVVT